METDQGWITSACYSPHVGSMIGLGYLEDGDTRLGEIIIAANPLEGESQRLRVVSPHFVDPEGGRLRV
jgi:sarcosine oxidase subunit alpha